MPRPGPRPYECVRRAWHSDRHHPIRGSLIQEIFRIVNEVHCSATRKNREWQEKLPIVVLRAEEIMYSKANSECTFLFQLWLAALHLGCTPRRSSRSQRNDSPRCYLRPETLDSNSLPDSNSNAQLYGDNTTSSLLMLHYPQYSRPGTMNPLNSCLKAENLCIRSRNSDYMKQPPTLPKNFAPSDNHQASVQIYSSSNAWFEYPLYYDNGIGTDDPKVCSLKPSDSYSHFMDSKKFGEQQSHSSFKLDASDLNSPSNHKHISNRGQAVECDLTLRLGSVVVPCASIDNGWPIQVENGKSSTLEGRKFSNCLNK
ncbi:UNVERIFIED_CONTAM: hypothetical protein Sradi_5576400 [Sesamum radiatum]|uniref:Uncharacterized protein n=1 Tax=Sesamum radiatum TaxID=300843 RepID=A0AAW2L1C6_SESRA